MPWPIKALQFAAFFLSLQRPQSELPTFLNGTTGPSTVRIKDL